MMPEKYLRTVDKPRRTSRASRLRGCDLDFFCHCGQTRLNLWVLIKQRDNRFRSERYDR